MDTNDIINVLKENGKVVAIRTDTVYGLICNANDIVAVEKIYQIKNRERKKPLALFIKNSDEIEKYVDHKCLTSELQNLLKKYWPGALTINFPKEEKTLEYINLQTKTSVAIRVPKVELLLKLMEEIDFPLAQTSCNVTNEKPYYKKIDIENNMKVDYVTDYGIELLSVELISSTIISILDGDIKIIRKGMVDIED